MSESDKGIPIHKDVVIIIGVAFAICMSIITGYIIHKINSVEGWLALLILPISIIGYLFAIAIYFDVES